MGLPILKEKTQTRRQHYEERVQQKGVETADPLSTSVGRIRIARTLELLENHIQIEGCRIADLGCGSGVIATLLANKGGEITAVDAVKESLASIVHPQITPKQAFLPYLTFPDAHFDGVVFTDVIAEMESHLYRLTFSELSRLLKGEGWLLCSTQLDLHSYDAFQRWIHLIETEFEIVDATKSFHRLHFYCTRWVKAPARFARAAREKEYRHLQLQKRSGLTRLWFSLNSSPSIAFFGNPGLFCSNPYRRLSKKAVHSSYSLNASLKSSGGRLLLYM